MSVINNSIIAGASGQAGGAAGYEIERSLRWPAGGRATSLYRTQHAGSQTTWTWSGWLKLGSLTSTYGVFAAGSSSSDYTSIYIQNNQIKLEDYTGGGQYKTDAVLRDPSAWYHVVIRVDTTNSTASHKVRAYVNGELQTWQTNPGWADNLNTRFNSAGKQNTIGTLYGHDFGSYNYDGLMAEVQFVDGLSLPPTAFGGLDDNGVWQPKAIDSAPNDGTVWSTYLTTDDGNFDSSYPKENAFDNNESSRALTNTAATNTSYIQFNSPVPLTGNLKVRCDNGNAIYDVTGGGSTLLGTNSSGSDNQRVNCGDVTNLTSLKILMTGGSRPGISKITLDEVTLIDGWDGLRAGAGSTLGRNSFHLKFNDPNNVGADNLEVNNFTNYNFIGEANATATAGSGSLDSTIFNGTDTKTYWRNPITITGISVPSGASFGYRGVIESGNPQPNHTITKNGVQIGSFTGTVGNNNWLASSNYTNNQGTISQEITPSDTVEITTDVEAWHGTDRIIINGNAIVILPSDQDCLFDSPTNGDPTLDTGLGGELTGNYCTWNPCCVTSGNTLSGGNLEANHTAIGWAGNPTGANHAMFVGTMGVTSGKWYWEGEFTSTATGSVGIVNKSFGLPYYVGYGANSAGYTSTYVYNNGYGGGVGSMPSYAKGDIIGVAIDMDNGKLYFSKNGTFINSGDPVAGTGFVGSGLTGDTVFPCVSNLSSGDAITFIANFGQRPFASSNVPTGFKALCTANLSDPDIEDPSTAMDVALYTGNGGTNSIDSVNHSPGFVWIKRRNSPSDHQLYDKARGANNGLSTNLSTGEWSYATGLSSFDSNGFTLGSLGGANALNDTHVAWSWSAGSTFMPKVYGDAATVSKTAGLSTNFIGTASPSPVPQSVQNYDIDFGSNVNSVDIRYTYTSASNIEYLTSTDGSTWTSLSTGNTQTANNTETITSGNAFRYLRFHSTSGNFNQGFQWVNNTLGSTDSTVLTNPSTGFSVVTYSGTGATASIGHGLNKVPQLIIIEDRNSGNWIVHHRPYSETNYGTNQPFFYLNLDLAVQASANYFTSVFPTADVFSVGTSYETNSSGGRFVAYCWAEIPGYSKFGWFTGNYSAQAPFNYTGFSPRWLLIRSAGAQNWVVVDSERLGYNNGNRSIVPNSNVMENYYTNVGEIDLYANGFKTGLRNNINEANKAIIWAAFAEHPFKTARAY